VLGQQLPPRIRSILLEIQHDLFNLGGELAMPDTAVMTEGDVLKLEDWIATFNSELPPLKEFILPSGQAPVGAIHLARAICRRAERAVVRLAHSEPDNLATRIYLNRLSDLLFIMARAVARESGGGEVLWNNTVHR
jgi:cob(I)alamin adenosyltransferase